MRLAGCRDCGALQRLPSLASAGSSRRVDGGVEVGAGVGALRHIFQSTRIDALTCSTCESSLERTTGRSLDLALASSAGALILLIPANLLTFLTTSILGVSRESLIASSATSMVTQGYPELALAFAMLVIVLPLIRFGLLTAVLGALRLGHRSRWLGPGFRLACSLQTWAMADVFLLGFVIAYARLHATITVELGAGAFCFIGAAILTLVTRASLDTHAVWRAIAPDREPGSGVPVIACGGCDLLLSADREGTRCPRCSTRLHARKPHAVARATAFAIAAAVLYVPANIYPMATLPIGFTSVKYTVLQGVVDLMQAKLFVLALTVFMASFAIPLLKLAGIAWCIASVLSRSKRHLIAKTRLYLVVEEIGRWSMVDPFVIACFVPVTQYNALVHGSAEPAAPVFAAVVILTTIAALCFDPRLLWDAAVDAREKT